MIDFPTWKRQNADDLQAGWDDWGHAEFSSIEEFQEFFYEQFLKELHKRYRGVGRKEVA